MYYPRHLQSVLQKLSAQFPAVLLTGARQVGKSTLLQHIAPEYGYLTLDDPLLLDQAKNEPQLFLLNHTPPLIVDEVQYAPELFPLLKMDIDRRKQNGLYLLSGSQAFELMQNVSESLAGRIAVLKLNGLSWREMRGDDFQTAFVPDEGYLADRNPVFRLPEHENIWQIIHRGDMPRLSAATLRQQPPQTRHQNPESLYAEHRPDGLPDQMADAGNHSKRSQERAVF